VVASVRGPGAKASFGQRSLGKGDVLSAVILHRGAEDEERVQLARALCVDAPILLADEPTAQLDPYHQLHIMDLLRREADGDRLVVTVLHDLTLAARYCDRLLLLDNGRLVADGTPQEVLSAAALRTVYRVESIVDRHEGQTLVIPWKRC